MISQTDKRHAFNMCMSSLDYQHTFCIASDSLHLCNAGDSLVSPQLLGHVEGLTGTLAYPLIHELVVESLYEQQGWWLQDCETGWTEQA